jgi:hypothetical protein
MTGAENPPPQATGDVQPRPSAGSGGGSGLRIGGWILVAFGGLLVVAGVALVVVHLTQRDKDGYYTSSTVDVAAPGYAVTSEALHLGGLPGFVSDALGRVRVSARSSNGQALFVGIAPQSDVNGYLGGVARSEVTDVTGSTAKYKTHPGGPLAGAPASRGFWQASGSGTSQVTTTWKVNGGTWAIVLMNADGSPAVSAAVKVGAQTNLVLWVGLGLLVAGLVAGGAGGAMLWSSRSR